MNLASVNNVLRKDKIRKKTEAYVVDLFKKYPRGLGGIISPCDYCVVERACFDDNLFVNVDMDICSLRIQEILSKYNKMICFTRRRVFDIDPVFGWCLASSSNQGGDIG